MKVEVASQFKAFDVYCKSKQPLDKSSPGCVLREGVLGVVLFFSAMLCGGGILPSLSSSLSPSPSPSSPPSPSPLSDSRPPAPVFVTPA